MNSRKPAYKLVIVESPAKARTISKFLGRNYKVEASQGHVRDLPKSQLGVDVEHDFEPKYITIRGRGEVLERIRKEAKGAKSIILATDPDREGEAISWHLATILGIDPESACRVEFNEITEKTVKSAIKQPRAVNMQLVNAQQARRLLDRLVGYKISPLLWVKIKKGLSAGRVQSVATRMVVDREQEIEQFEPEEYWYVDAELRAGGKQLHARLIALDGERVSLSDQAQADAAKARVEQGGFVIRSVKRGEKRKHPAPPFTTSNLQQEASRKLGFTTAKTMQIAQQLYEGVDIEGRGTLGLISYIRTDSVRLSDEAVAAAREAIAARYGAEYVPEKPNVYKGRKSAQDAHEAIRPANIDLRPEEIKASLTKDQFNLYKLVYLRFVACQMADALYETQQIEIASESGAVLRSSAERLKFAGFTAVYEEGTDDAPAQDEAQAGAMADVNEGDKAELLALFRKLRARIPGLVLRTSLITGLPYEDEAAFEELCEFLQEVRIERAGVFPYSPEEGTPAAKMLNRVDTDEAERRADLVVDVQSRIMDDFNDSRMGGVTEVLCDGFDSQAMMFVGRSYAESPDIDGRIYFTAGYEVEAGEFVPVRITGAMDGELTGEGGGEKNLFFFCRPCYNTVSVRRGDLRRRGKTKKKG